MILYYIAAAVVLTILGSLFGWVHHTMTEPLIMKAWANGKKIRTVFYIFLLGPIVWAIYFLRITPMVAYMMTVFFLQEDQ